MKKIIFIGLAFVLIVSGCSIKSLSKSKDILTIEEAKATTLDFINNSLMPKGKEASIKEAVKEGGLFKIIVSMPDKQEITSYLSADGKNFFPQVMNIEEYKKKAEEKKNNESATKEKELTEIIKNNKPEVELFVMSHCPYGTQVEKGILPVVKALGDKIDFKVRFCDYSMHGKKELDEELNQYCIQKNEPEKLLAYLNCFLADETSSKKCIKETKINKTKLNTCVANTDKKYKVTEMFNDKSTWSSGRFPQFNVNKELAQKYGVKGSPGLVINGVKISSGRDSSSLLKTICAGFKEQPKECEEKLSSVAPSPGFGFSKSGGGSNGSCE